MSIEDTAVVGLDCSVEGSALRDGNRSGRCVRRGGRGGGVLSGLSLPALAFVLLVSIVSSSYYYPSHAARSNSLRAQSRSNNPTTVTRRSAASHVWGSSTWVTEAKSAVSALAVGEGSHGRCFARLVRCQARGSMVEFEFELSRGESGLVSG